MEKRGLLTVCGILPFYVSEYTERLEKVKRRMEQTGVEVLLVSDPANIHYLSGYDGWSFYVPQLLVVIGEEEQPIWIGRNQDANGARLTTWFHPDRIIPYPEEYVQAAERHPMDFVVDVLRRLDQAGRRIGVELDAYYFTARSFEQLKKGLPNARFQDATLLVNRVRMVKSEQEIEYMQRAARIAEEAMGAGIGAIGAGVRECDAAARISFAQICGTPDFGGDYPSIVPLLPSGIKTSTPHLTWSDSTYQEGDVVILELAGCHRRYHSPLARTAVIGKVPTPVKDLAEVVGEGLNAALEAVKPGTTCEEVEAAWRRVIQPRGYRKDSRLGYSVGLNYPPDWGEHTASIRAGDRTILQPNMTFHLIAGIWLDQFGIELSETFRVTETGCEVLARYPRELIQLPKRALATLPMEENGA